MNINRLLLALVLCAVSAVMNYLFLASLGKTPIEGQVLGAASAAADVLKALLPFFIAWSWAARRRVAAVSGTLAFLFFAGFSLLSAIGFAADNRGALVEGREGKSQTYNRVRAALTDADSRLSAMPTHRPVSVVSEEIEQQRQSRRWSTTKDCKNATETESRAFCAEYFRLRGELAAASEADGIRESITALQGEADALRRRGAGQDTDPQVTLLSRILGQEPEGVRLALIIAVALLVEIGASLGLFLASGHRIAPMAPAPLPVRKPTGCVEQFCLEALTPSACTVVSKDDVFAGYEAWCASRDLAALGPAQFHTAFDAIASAINLPKEGAGYRGIALAAAELPLAA